VNGFPSATISKSRNMLRFLASVRGGHRGRDAGGRHRRVSTPPDDGGRKADGPLSAMPVAGAMLVLAWLGGCAPDSRSTTAQAAATSPATQGHAGSFTVEEDMEAIDPLFDRLTAARKHGWPAPVAAAADATDIAGILSACAEDQEARAMSEEFRAWMRDCAARAENLAASIKTPSEETARRFNLLAMSCATCHDRYRN
jgi:hypothetical protein